MRAIRYWLPAFAGMTVICPFPRGNRTESLDPRLMENGTRF